MQLGAEPQDLQEVPGCGIDGDDTIAQSVSEERCFRSINRCRCGAHLSPRSRPDCNHRTIAWRPA